MGYDHPPAGLDPGVWRSACERITAEMHEHEANVRKVLAVAMRHLVSADVSGVALFGEPQLAARRTRSWEAAPLTYEAFVAAMESRSYEPPVALYSPQQWADLVETFPLVGHHPQPRRAHLDAIADVSARAVLRLAPRETRGVMAAMARAYVAKRSVARFAEMVWAR